MHRKDDELQRMLGEPKKAIRSLAIALSVSYLVIQLNQFVDTFWTAGLGDVSMSAVSLMSPIYWIISASGIGVGVGVASTIAFRLGEDNRQRASELASNSLVLGFILSLITSVLMGIFIDPILTLLNADDVRSDSIAYVFPFIVLASAIILNGIVSGLLRAEGAGRKSMIVLILSATINMVMDPVLIYSLDLKVAGAGWATAIGALLSTVIGVYWYTSGRMQVKMTFKGYRVDRTAMKEIMTIGGPRTVEALVTGITNVLQRIPIIMVGGTMAVMLYNVPFRYISLIIVIAEALGAATIPVCSAALGQRDVKKMRLGLRYSVRLSFVLVLICSIAIFVFADPLMSVFTTSESMNDHHDELVWVLRMFCIFAPFDGIRKLGSCHLQVLRRSKLSSRAMMLWGFVKILAYLIGAQFSFHVLIVSCVLVYIFGGLMFLGLARYVDNTLNGRDEDIL